MSPVGFLTRELTFIPSKVVNASSIEADGIVVATGEVSGSIQLSQGIHNLTVRITSPAGERPDYSIELIRADITEFAEEAACNQAREFGQTSAFGFAVALSSDCLAVGAFSAPAVFVLR